MMLNIHFVPSFIFCIQWHLNTIYKISTNKSAALSASNSEPGQWNDSGTNC